MDNTRGYSADNVTPCCDLCNTIKGAQFTADEMLRLGVVISEIRLNRQALGQTPLIGIHQLGSAGRARLTAG